MQKILAIVTMVYNEADFLPIWVRHYGRAVGEENCFVVDHGSDDGSTDGLGSVNRVRVPRSPMDEERRCRFLSDFCSSLLAWYDAVAYTDSDELLVADPTRAVDLVTLVADTQHPVLTAFGVNVLHRMHHDVPLQRGPISTQRRWIYPNSSMAKPLITREPIAWPPGFHSYDGPPLFDALFNMHLANVDLDIALRRQAKRRTVTWASPISDSHPHKVDDQQVANDFLRWSSLPVAEGVTLDGHCTRFQWFMNRIRLSSYGRERARYKTDMNIWSRVLWHLPERFIGCF